MGSHHLEAEKMRAMPRSLIIDQDTFIPVELCRTLSKQGSLVDIFAEQTSYAFHSKFCNCPFRSPPWYVGRPFFDMLENVVDNGHYDAIYLCTDAIVDAILPLTESQSWRGLLLPKKEAVKAALSKNASIQIAANAGVPIPRTVVPDGRKDVESVGKDIGFPLVVKGDQGAGSQNVRVVKKASELLNKYLEIEDREKSYHGRPALQEFIDGPTSLVGGLFHNGRALRLCAHEKTIMNPPGNGATVKAVTIHHRELIDSALRFYETLQFTGLGSVDFIRDIRDGRFKFLEINPRIWGSVGVAQYAGVDLFTPYRALVRGDRVEPRLEYRTGVSWHRFSGEAHVIRSNPLRIFGLLKDCLDPRVHSDFRWSDPGPFFAGMLRLRQLPEVPARSSWESPPSSKGGIHWADK